MPSSKPPLITAPVRGSVIAAAAAAIATVATAALTPPAWADPDPHFPNGATNWCPAGQPPGYGGQRYCIGESFADGTFYAQTWSLGPSGPFGPGAWMGQASCSRWIEGSIQGARPGCGGGPQFVQVS
jgi:hypothetical protein